MTALRFHRILALLIMLAAVALTPLFTASANLSNRTQVERNFQALRLLHDRATPATTVTKLVTRLVKLDPRGAVGYDRIGIKKLGNKDGAFLANTKKLAARVIAILRKSPLPRNKIASFIFEITKLNDPNPVIAPGEK